MTKLTKAEYQILEGALRATKWPDSSLNAAVEKILAGRLAVVEAERDALRRWKDEALEVITGLHELGRALDILPGERITGPSAVEAVEALKAERDRLRAQVTRALALAEEWDQASGQVMVWVAGFALRDVIAGDPDVSMQETKRHETPDA